jgi:hypothetical protein
MAGQFGQYSGNGGGGVPVYTTFSAFPATANNGSLAVAGDTDTLYVYSSTGMQWEPIGGTAVPLGVGTYDSQAPSAKGLVIANNLIYAQSASGTVPGMVNDVAQTFAGQKTFSTGLTGSLTGAASLNVLTSALGTVTETISSVLTLTSWTNATVGSPTITVKQSSSVQSGYLSSTDWNTFNNKQAAGNYITSLTGDVSASGPGSAAATLATVNANVGNFGSASSVGSFTVNAKGLTTAASSISIQITEAQVTNLTSDLAGKQAGPLTGDVTTSGAVATLATVNSNVGSFTNANITVNAKGLVTAASNGTSSSSTAPTIQQFLTGSGTYTTPSVPSPLYIRVVMVGGGGGGGGSAQIGSTAGAATNGGNTTFGTSLLAANGGTASGNAFNTTGPTNGGSASLGSAIGIALTGGMGQGGGYLGAGNTIYPEGGQGGSSAFGGAGGGGAPESASGNGSSGVTNTGGGGGGAAGQAGGNSWSGAGGGSGGYVDAIITSPSATYLYAVGSNGSGGAAGSSGANGGNGGSGMITVYEFYQ